MSKPADYILSESELIQLAADFAIKRAKLPDGEYRCHVEIRVNNSEATAHIWRLDE